MTDTRGILHPRRGFEHFRLHRPEPSAALAPYVDRLWCVSWELDDDEVFEQPILAHPAINLVIEPERAAVYGVPSRLGRQRLSGTGWAVAAMFRPGGAGPFVGSAREWVDRVMDVAGHWGAPGADLVAAIRAVPGSAEEAEADRTAVLDSFLSGRAPAAVPVGTSEATAAAALIASDRDLCTVDQLAAATGLGIRALQRLFAEHIGLSPKKVIRRYRLLEAAEAASTGTPVVWADVARQLGFSDQAHLTRDFTAAFGMSPGRYASA